MTRCKSTRQVACRIIARLPAAQCRIIHAGQSLSGELTGPILVNRLPVES
jgi:hypothetical protein